MMEAADEKAFGDATVLVLPVVLVPSPPQKESEVQNSEGRRARRIALLVSTTAEPVVVLVLAR